MLYMSCFKLLSKLNEGNLTYPKATHTYVKSEPINKQQAKKLFTENS